MVVRALFFASHRELLGLKELSVELPLGSTVDALMGELRERGGPFTALPLHPAVAVNRAYVPNATLLSDGDEVALIPPVAGG